MATALKVLLTRRHMHEYSEFASEYRRCASDLELPRAAEVPAKTQYYKWLAGQLKDLPRGYHCQVLEQMFPGWTARQLFGPPEVPVDDEDLLASVRPAIDPAILAGVWATAYRFDDTYHHADLSIITMAGNSFSACNYPPEPRTEAHSVGYRNNIEAAVGGRHIVGRWRNSSDNYYFGSLHLSIQPGENVLDGIYTGFPVDTQIVAQRWRWIRVKVSSAQALAAVRLRDPRELHDMIMDRAHFDGPILLDELTED